MRISQFGNEQLCAIFNVVWVCNLTLVCFVYIYPIYCVAVFLECQSTERHTWFENHHLALAIVMPFGSGWLACRLLNLGLLLLLQLLLLLFGLFELLLSENTNLCTTVRTVNGFARLGCQNASAGAYHTVRVDIIFLYQLTHNIVGAVLSKLLVVVLRPRVVARTYYLNIQVFVALETRTHLLDSGECCIGEHRLVVLKVNVVLSL